MSVSLLSNFKALLPWIIVYLTVPSTADASQMDVGCARTPAEAAGANHLSNASEPSRLEMGYRVTAVRLDPLLRQRWATVVSCGHPELPSFALLLASQREAIEKSIPSIANGKFPGTTSLPVVRTGDQVYLWSADHNLHIETSGIAEGSGSEGDIVRVRLVYYGVDNQQPQQIVSGVIRGQGEVEMQQ